MFILLLVFVAAQLAQMASDPPAPGGGPDELVYVSHHTILTNYWRSGENLNESVLATSMRKPHLPYFVSYFFSKIWPEGYLSVVASSMVFALAWFVLIYLIGCRVFTPAVAFAGVCIMAGIDISYELFGHFVNDVHLCFFSAAILLLLIFDDRLTRIWQWVGLGVLVGLGLLSKPTLPVYVGGSILVLLFTTLRHAKGVKEKNLWLTISIGALLATALTLVLWLGWFKNPLETIMMNLSVIASNPGKNYAFFHSFSGNLPPKDMSLFAGWPATILLIIGFTVSMFRLRDTRRIVLMAALVPTAILFGVFAVSFSRLTYPVWFIAAFFAIDLLDDLPQEKLRPWIIGGVGIVFLMLSTQRPATLVMQPTLSNPAYLPKQAVEYIEENQLLDEPADILYFDQCTYKKEAFPLGLFMVMNLQNLRNAGFVHFYDGTTAEPINDDNLETFKRRLASVEILVVCNGELAGNQIDPNALLKETYTSMIAFRPECCSGFFYPPKLEYRESFEAFSDHEFGCEGRCRYHLYTKVR